jgi:polar amino acid transport system substrate-binding protein
MMVATTLVAACGSDVERVTSQEFAPIEDGVLTVATALPAAGYWEGDVGEFTGGFEYGVATELAERFDLDLRVVDVPFADIVAGELGDADVALAQVSVTDERRAAVEFSVPYLTDDFGVVTRPGDDFTDLKTAREQRWAVEADTVEAEFLDDVVRPDAAVVVVDDQDAAIDAVADGRVDAALLDLRPALVAAGERDDVTVGARFATSLPIAAVLPLDSPNRELVDAAFRALDNDGTLADLEAEYLVVEGTTPSQIPVIRTPD